MRGAGTEERTFLTEDGPSFTEPLAQAWDACIDAYIDAGAPVSGALLRVGKAKHELDSLKQFEDELARLTDAQTFHDLPQLWQGRERLDSLHSLTVGPWRGVFLVSRDPTAVLALLFSKHPHDIGSRLMEVASPHIAARNRAQSESGDDD